MQTRITWEELYDEVTQNELLDAQEYVQGLVDKLFLTDSTPDSEPDVLYTIATALNFCINGRD